MAPQYDMCEKCKNGFYVPEKSINTGDTWFFCNNCFKYHPQHDEAIGKSSPVYSPRNGGLYWDDSLHEF